MVGAEGERTFLGRYELLFLLGQGGMGEVHLARLSGAAGFEKLCIIKTILPQMNADPQFVDRFHHEAKVLVQLNHSNIAQVHDMSEADGTLFMAIEYVPGVDLSRVMDRARAQGSQMPIEVALKIGQQVCEALGYAHRKTGPEGQSLGIVHRDVSPQNVMVSYEGEVKVIDFGLAKSSARSKATLPSTVMGKLGYMSPEQARGDKVDSRSDTYSAGIVLWELLAGRPLFNGATMGEMVAQMMHPQVPLLRTVRPGVSERLEEVVAKALQAAPQDRFARCDDFARALNELSVRESLSIGSEEVGNYVRSVCPDEYASERKLRSKLSEIRRQGVDAIPAAIGLGSPVPGVEPSHTRATPMPTRISGSSAVPAPGQPAPIQLRQSRTVPPEAMGPRSEMAFEVAAPSRSRGPQIAALGAVVILLGGGGFAVWRVLEGSGSELEVKSRVEPPPVERPPAPTPEKPGLEVETPRREDPVPHRRIDVSGQPFRVINKGDELRVLLSSTVRLKEGEGVKLFGPPLEGTSQRELLAVGAVEVVKGSLATLVTEADPNTLPKEIYGVRDDSVVKPRPKKPAAVAAIGKTTESTPPIEPAKAEPAKTEPAKIERPPLELGKSEPVKLEPTKPADLAPEAAEVRSGLKVEVRINTLLTGDYIYVINNENQSLSGCLIILPGGYGYQFRKSELIRANGRVELPQTSFSKYGWVGWTVENRTLVERRIGAAHTAYVGCQEAVGYVDFRKRR